MKRCFKCNKKMPLSGFYKHAQMADGHLNKCKECTKADVIKYRGDNLEKIKEYDRNRAQQPKRKRLRKAIAEKWKKDPKLRKRRNELQRKWVAENSLKRAAHVMVGKALKRGELRKGPCDVCGKKKTEAHHDDYLRPFDIRWLCKKHHTEVHVGLRNKQRDTRKGRATQREAV